MEGRGKGREWESAHVGEQMNWRQECTTAAPVLTRVSMQHGLAYLHLPLSSSTEVNADPLGSVTPLAHPGITDAQKDWMPPIHLLGSDTFS